MPDIRAWLKRNRDWIAHVTPFLVALASVIVIGFTVRSIDLLARLDTLVGDYQISVLSPPEPQDQNLVIAAINEDTLSNFPYREPVDRGFLADMLTAIAAQHPRAIGLDILLDTPSDPVKDERLRTVLHSLSVPIAVSFVTNSSVVTDEQRKYLNAFVPKRDRAFATLATDNHDIARWIFPGADGPDGHFIPTFPRLIAERVGVETPAGAVKIVWHGQPSPNEPAFKEYPMIPRCCPSIKRRNCSRERSYSSGRTCRSQIGIRRPSTCLSPRIAARCLAS